MTHCFFKKFVMLVKKMTKKLLNDDPCLFFARLEDAGAKLVEWVDDIIVLRLPSSIEKVQRA